MVRINPPPSGCWCPTITSRPSGPYLPLLDMQAHAIIKDVSSRTVLTQTFCNDTIGHLEGVVYSFPLYDGVSVVSFTATIGDVQIQGIVKEKQKARREYQDAVNKGLSAGLLEQLPEASDVFITKIGNVPAGAKVVVEIVYIGELRHDAESDGTRFTIPSSIAPRYGPTPSSLLGSSTLRKAADGIRVTVDFQSPEGCPIQQIQSPSHPITVSVGRTTDMPATSYMANRGSATLSLDQTILEDDFVVIASVKDADRPKAFLETHTTISNQRALMATLVPRFNIAPTYGEIVFIVDRSGSMDGKMNLVIKAMTILLKSLPVGTKFNICSFGGHHSFLWPRSRSYNDENLSEALNYVDAFQSNFGGTEMYPPVQATIDQRFTDMSLDAIILTDGEIWNQGTLFQLIRTASADSKCRFFSLGIGSGASTALVEGIATAGNGFSQFVAEGEKMDKKMIRLLKGALMPQINDYNIEVKYKLDNEDFEIVESVRAPPKVDSTLPMASTGTSTHKAPISFFQDALDVSFETNDDRFAHLPIIPPPPILQAPRRIPPLYPFSRTTVYLLLDPSTYHRTPEAIILRATCPQGPLELEIKVEDIGKGETIHQLAAKRAVSEIEQDGGWLATATDKADGTLIKKKYTGRWDEFMEREAIRLGVQYQIAGKWCSFVALEGSVEHEVTIVGEKIGLPSQALINQDSAAMFGQSYRRARRSPSSASFGSMSTGLFGSLSAKFSRAPPKPSLFSTPASYQQQQETTGPPAALPRRTSGMSGLHRFRRLATRAQEAMPEEPEWKTPTEAVKSDDEKMHEIIRLQKYDGSWEWNERLRGLLEIHLERGRQNAITATALVIVFFQKRMAHEAAIWDLIVEKARVWLGQQQGVDLEKEINEAEKLFG
ncbi:von Willebrand factor type A domain-containing protein [Nemania abortiva]|nr:von Willebrand factor type A domain-containing protein [Nemania abortiva]